MVLKKCNGTASYVPFIKGHIFNKSDVGGNPTLEISKMLELDMG